MRGRTLDDAFVILDEAQNTTHAQMKMFLTRLGFGSKMVVTGDPTPIRHIVVLNMDRPFLLSHLVRTQEIHQLQRQVLLKRFV